jgi:hypothetical protein
MGNCAGIDWASEKHDVLIEDPGGEELLAATFAHDEDGVSALAEALRTRYVRLEAATSAGTLAARLVRNRGRLDERRTRLATLNVGLQSRPWSSPILVASHAAATPSRVRP